MVNPTKEWNRSDNLNKLLSLLKTHKEMRFQELKEALGVSEPTLAEYVKALEQQTKIEHFDKPTDRRHTWYRIKPDPENIQKVEAQVGKYEAVKFIESLVNPVHAYEEKNRKAVAVFTTEIEPRLHNLTQKMLSQIAKRYLSFLPVPQMPGQKTVVVIMVKGKEEVRRQNE